MLNVFGFPDLPLILAVQMAGNPSGDQVQADGIRSTSVHAHVLFCLLPRAFSEVTLAGLAYQLMYFGNIRS